VLRFHGVCLNQKHSRLKEIAGRGIAYNLIETNCNVGAEIFAPTLYLSTMLFPIISDAKHCGAIKFPHLIPCLNKPK
jgi:hypothetical protein